MQKGKINVQTENIFPIIKKFLYSDHEIFLRELVSNAVDASTKLMILSKAGKLAEDLGDMTIQVKVDKKKGTLSVIDRGIGMNAEEVEKYINQIAFSSAEEFIKKYKGKSEADKNALIGHFGLGFYSAFMVSDKVEIRTKTYKKGGATKAVHWECDGSPEYVMKEDDKEDRGTEIILHISKENAEFLEEYRVLELLRKYCRFLPVPVQCGMEKSFEPVEGEKDKDGNPKTREVEKPRVINNTSPAWTRKPTELKDEDYSTFYRELYPMNFEDPLFHIHLNVDYPFNLTGVLYFPKVKRNFEVQRDKIQLYCNQVFVTDSVEGIVPDFLTLLHGVIDSPDIPLNVSRSYLQSDPNVKKISQHITKKVADKLEELFKTDREAFEKKWDDIKVFIQYGMVSEDKFYDRAAKFCLLKNTDGKYFTFDEYTEHIKALQTDKDKRIIHLYAADTDLQYSYIQGARERGYDVLVMDSPLDNHFINMLEQKRDKCHFARVDSDTLEKLIPHDETIPSKLSEEQQKSLQSIIEKQLEKEKFTLVFESLSEKEQPFQITVPEFMRRMKDMAQLGGQNAYFANLPEQYNVVVNSNHPLIAGLLDETDEVRQTDLVREMKDLALLSQNLLKGQALNDFVHRSLTMIGKRGI